MQAAGAGGFIIGTGVLGISAPLYIRRTCEAIKVEDVVTGLIKVEAFAIMIVLNLTIGMITPPVGPVLFVVSTIGRVRLETLSKAIVPLLLAELFVLALVIAFPAISITVPKLFGITH